MQEGDLEYNLNKLRRVGYTNLEKQGSQQNDQQMDENHGAPHVILITCPSAP